MYYPAAVDPNPTARKFGGSPKTAFMPSPCLSPFRSPDERGLPNSRIPSKKEELDHQASPEADALFAMCYPGYGAESNCGDSQSGVGHSPGSKTEGCIADLFVMPVKAVVDTSSSFTTSGLPKRSISMGAGKSIRQRDTVSLEPLQKKRPAHMLESSAVESSSQSNTAQSPTCPWYQSNSSTGDGLWGNNSASPALLHQQRPMITARSSSASSSGAASVASSSISSCRDPGLPVVGDSVWWQNIGTYRQPRSFVSPPACHAKNPPTSQSPSASVDDSLRSSSVNQSASQFVCEKNFSLNEENIAKSSKAESQEGDPGGGGGDHESPWWSLTNATFEQRTVSNDLWTDQSRPRPYTPPPSEGPASTARASLSHLTVPRLDPFGNVHGPPTQSSKGTHLCLPDMEHSLGARSAAPFDYLVSASQSTQLPPLRPPRTANQGPFPADGSDDRCEVCWDRDQSVVNPIIECQGCKLRVHQQCYGVCRNENKVSSEWLCAMCLYWHQLRAGSWPLDGSTCDRLPPPLLYCALCNRPKGAMKVGNEGRWVHVACVLYSQEGPTFRDLAGRSNPINIEKNLVTHSRNRYSCSICRSTDGYTTNCSFPGCLKRVHVACVFASGFRPKLQTISADVPLYPNAFLLPGSTAPESSETRIIEKLVKIITCETHASENAYNAVELYEKKLLKKMDFSVATAGNTSSSGEGYLPAMIAPTLHSGYPMAGTAYDTSSVAPRTTQQSTQGDSSVSPTGSKSLLAPSVQSRLPIQSQASQPSSGLWQQPTARPVYQPYPGPAPAGAYRLPNGVFVPGGYPMGAAMPGAPPYYLPSPWHVNAYANYHALRAYGTQTYTPALYTADGRPAASSGQSGYPNPAYWSSTGAYGSMLNRHHSSFTRVNNGGPRGAAGINKSRSLVTREDGNESTSMGHSAIRKREMTSDMRPLGNLTSPLTTSRRAKPAKAAQSGLRAKPEGSTPSGATTKLLHKASQSLLSSVKMKKNEQGSPRPPLAEDELLRKSSLKAQAVRKKAGGRAASTTSAAPSSSQRKESKVRAVGSVRRKIEEEDDFGTASGHIVGSAISSRGVRINWAKIDNFFRSVRQVGEHDQLYSYITRSDNDLGVNVPLSTWSWILEEDSLEGSTTFPTEKYDATLKGLRSIWLDTCLSSENAIEAPIAVMISAKVPSENQASEKEKWGGLWTFWSALHKDGTDEAQANNAALSPTPVSCIAHETNDFEDNRTPLRRANLREESSSCHLTLSASPFKQSKVRRAEETSEASHIMGLRLLQAYALTNKHAACLRRRCETSITEVKAHIEAKRAEQGSLMRDGGAKSPSLGLNKSLLTVDSGTDPNSANGGDEFYHLTQRIQSKHEDPTGSRAEALLRSLDYPKKKSMIDMINWNDIIRIESSVLNKFPLPHFFILLKKLPPELTRSGAAPAASSHLAAIQKFFSSKESVSLVLDPAAARRVVTASKKIYLHGHIWDLNPSFPSCERFFRHKLPQGSLDLGSPEFDEAVRAISMDNTGSPPIPIPDETSREWLAAAQRMRLASSQSESGLLAEHDRQAAIRGESLVKILVLEQYWKRLMFEDDFVKRQGLFALMLWAKKRSRLNFLKDKVRRIVQHEVESPKRIIDSEAAVDTLRKQAESASRWSAFRAAMIAGHQDPSSALVARVEAEYKMSTLAEAPTVEASTASKVYFCTVCFGTELDNLDPLVTCARCSIKVHKNCYGVGQPAQLDLDIMEWYCDRCDSEKKVHVDFRPNTCRCCLCLRHGGALKKFSGQAYIHITCALWSYPLIYCTNLYRVSNWRFRDNGVTGIAQTRSCRFCAMVGDSQAMGGNRKRRTTRDRMLLRVVEDDEDEPMEQVLFKQEEQIDDTPTAELPLGMRGLACKCAHEGCDIFFHPICAWLRGLRVVARDNFLESISLKPQDVFLPSLDIKAYCEEHTIMYSPGTRLPLDVISQHRLRAYVYRDTDDFSFAPAKNSVPQASSNIHVLSSSSVVTVEAGKDVHPPATGEILSSLGADHSGGSRRPSLNRDLIENDVVMSQQDKTLLSEKSLPVCSKTLADRDIYTQTLCQACFLDVSENTNTTTDLSSTLIHCSGCDVRVHSTCSRGVFDTSPSASHQRPLNTLCRSCLRGGDLHCSLCPRLGGAMCEVPGRLLAQLLHCKDEGVATFMVHKICLLSHVRPDKANEFETLLQQYLLPPENNSEAERCEICEVSEGYLVACVYSNCGRRAHVSCAALTNSLQQTPIGTDKHREAIEVEGNELQGAKKRRRLTDALRVRYSCLKHQHEAGLNEGGMKPLLLHYQNAEKLRARVKSILDVGIAISGQQRKQQERLEECMTTELGFGMTKLDASYGISYEHADNLSQFVRKAVYDTASPPTMKDLPSYETAAEETAREEDDAAAQGATLEGDALSSCASSNVLVANGSHVNSTMDQSTFTTAVEATNGTSHTSEDGTGTPTPTEQTVPTSISFQQEKEKGPLTVTPCTTEPIGDLREGQHESGPLPNPAAAGPKNVYRQTCYLREEDGDSTRHPLLSKQSISQMTTTTSSLSDSGRRKRKRAIIDAESEEEENFSTEQAPHHVLHREDSTRAATSNTEEDDEDEDVPRSVSRRHARKPEHSQNRHSSGSRKAGTAKSTPTSRRWTKNKSTTAGITANPKRRRVASLPLRNERGQFIRKSTTKRS